MGVDFLTGERQHDTPTYTLRERIRGSPGTPGPRTRRKSEANDNDISEADLSSSFCCTGMRTTSFTHKTAKDESCVPPLSAGPTQTSAGMRAGLPSSFLGAQSGRDSSFGELLITVTSTHKWCCSGKYTHLRRAHPSTPVTKSS